ncbi:MAG: hypothetical protein GYB67_05885, partial [Chloroflexi bacterium]|nr:hypothetical protein [Chloroflexota bacterium]
MKTFKYLFVIVMLMVGPVAAQDDAATLPEPEPISAAALEAYSFNASASGNAMGINVGEQLIIQDLAEDSFEVTMMGASLAPCGGQPTIEFYANSRINDACAGVEFVLAQSGAAFFVNPDNDFITALTLDQVAAALANAETWAEVDPAFPAEPIVRYLPSDESRTFDLLVETFFDFDYDAVLDASNLNLQEDNFVLAQGVLDNEFAIGVFPEFIGAEVDLTPVEIAEGNPLAETIIMLASLDLMQSDAEYANLVLAILTVAPASAEDLGFQPATDAQRARNAERYAAALAGMTLDDTAEPADAVEPTEEAPAPTEAAPPAEEVPEPTEEAASAAPEDMAVTCVVTANANVNVRSGPGTNNAVARTLGAGENATVDGQANGADGFVWWRLADGGWVRSDTVAEDANCEQTPVVTN